MPEMHGHKFEFPMIKSDLSPERRDAVNRHFMKAAERLERLKPVRYAVIRKQNVKKG